MTPTREQVIQWAKAAGLSFEDGWIFYKPKRPSLPEAEIDAFIAAVSAAYAAARAQALDEAAGVCATERAEFLEQSARNDGRQSDMAFGSVNSSERIAAAIQALKGKQ